MPKSTLMGLRWVFAPAAAFVAAMACCPPAGAIVGGKQVIVDGNPPTTGPLNYQVALIRNDRPYEGRKNSPTRRSAYKELNVPEVREGDPESPERCVAVGVI